MKCKQPEKEVSIILPAYNEELQIEKCLLEVETAIISLTKSYEIIVSEDGSRDGPELVVSKIANNNPNLFLLHSTKRLGKGKAIRNALNFSNGKIIVFMDVDLATSLECLSRLLVTVKETCGVAIGSRHVKGSCVDRRLTRTLFSLVYNLLVRSFFLEGIHDHQCGFKAMSREIAEVVLSFSKSDGFFFDTEMILCCKKLGFSVVEIPVKWSEKRKKGNSKVNLFQDAKRIGLDMLTFWLNSNK